MVAMINETNPEGVKCQNCSHTYPGIEYYSEGSFLLRRRCPVCSGTGTLPIVFAEVWGLGDDWDEHLEEHDRHRYAVYFYGGSNFYFQQNILIPSLWQTGGFYMIGGTT
jgi:hypothetical protein